MATSTSMKMVNGRVDAHLAAKAAKVLKGQGLTVSAFIRNSIEHVARTGSVPQSGLPAADDAGDLARLQAVIKNLEALPMPGKHEHGALSGDELVERLRMERYGY